jgi:K+-sensing histidine kinase KdpD
MIYKVLVCITPQANGKRLIDKGYEIALQTKGELHILHVEKGDQIFVSEESSQLLQWLFDYGSERGGMVHGICGEDVISTIRQFIKTESITHAVFGESPAASNLNGEKGIESFRVIMPYIQLHILERDKNAPAEHSHTAQISSTDFSGIEQ